MVQNAVSEYMDYATIHGIGRTKNSPFVLLRVFWIFALCASLGVISWQVYELYQTYQSYPISTSIEITTARKLYFPDVTLCNTNPVIYDLLPQDSLMYDVIYQAGVTYSIDLDVYNRTDDIYKYNFTRFDKNAEDKDLKNDILWNTKEQFKMRMSVVRDDELKNFSQPVADFVLLCNFAGVNCSTEQFRAVRTYDYGLCYHFEPDKHGVLDDGNFVSATGQRYALELVLNVGQSDNVPFITSSAGVAVFIQHPDNMGINFVTDDSVFVPTGFEASIGVTQAKRKRVPGKNKDRCHDEYFATTLLECRQTCHYTYIMLKCNCFMDFSGQFTSYPTNYILNETFDELGNPPCHEDEHYKCIQAVIAELVKTTPAICSQCIPPCDETYFERDVTMFTWPSDNFLPILRRILQKRYQKWDGSQTAKDFVKGNLALVRIFLKSLTYQTMTEEYSYTTVNFISDIGGQLGLWAGFSILSILEIIEMFMILCARVKRRRTKTSVTSN